MLPARSNQRSSAALAIVSTDELQIPIADETARYFHLLQRRSSSALNFCCHSGSWPFAAHQASYANRISAVASDAPGRGHETVSGKRCDV